MTLHPLLALLLSAPQAAPVVQQSRPSGELIVEGVDTPAERVSLAAFRLEDLAGRDAVFLRIERDPSAAAPRLAEEGRAQVELAGGDRLQATVMGGEGDTLHLRLIGGARLDLLVDRLRSLVFPTRLSTEAQAGLRAAESGDVLYWLRPGGTLDTVPGTLVSFGDDGPRLEGAFGERSFAWSEVAALFIEPLGDLAPEVEEAGGEGLRPGARAIVELVDGGRLRGRLESLTAQGAVLVREGDERIALPFAALSEIVADDGRVRFLSDLAPARVEEGSPFGDDLGLTWPHRMDASVTGTPLRAGGRTWRRGIGVHAPSRLTFELGGAWGELRGTCAIDDSVLLLPTRGSVVFRVRVDGEERWASGIVRGGEPLLALPAIDLSGARELVLEVEMASEFHVGDRADWLRMLLVREP